MNEKVSIIMPTFNNMAIIEEIKSKILSLSENLNFHIIIVDDSSSDGTYSELIDFRNNHKIQNLDIYKNDTNRGPSFSRNIGIKEAKSEYIAFLDSDDDWHPQKIDIQIKMMKEYNVMLCGTSYKIINNLKELESEKNKDFKNRKNIPYENIKWPKILFISPFPTSSVVIHSSIKNYLFNENIRYSEDYNLWKLITYNYKAIKILLPLTYTFKHDYISEGNSLSTNLKKMQQGINKSFLSLIKSSKVKISDKPILFFALLFSQLKYFRRIVKAKIKR